MNESDWFEKFGWENNPFSFKIFPKLIVGYAEELADLKRAISTDNKLSIISGPSGAGKTSILQWLRNQDFQKEKIFYLPKPPESPKELLSFFVDHLLKPSPISRVIHSYTLYNIHDYINRKKRTYVVLIDECHEASIPVLMWTRTLLDHIQDLIIVIAALPPFIEYLKENLGTFYSRITFRLDLRSLTLDETYDLIKKRINNVGGSEIHPFTSEAIIALHKISGGFPREVLRICNRLILKAIKQDKSIIDVDFLESVVDHEKQVHMKKSREKREDATSEYKLSDKQKKVISLLKEYGELSSVAITEKMNTTGYSSEIHALRSTNNILKRLLDRKIVDRKRKGRTYTYFLGEGVK